MKQLEIEFKSLLGEKDYRRLCDHYQLAEKNFHTQTNVYFDTVDQQLQAQRCGLRIRKYATHGEITLKTPQGWTIRDDGSINISRNQSLDCRSKSTYNRCRCNRTRPTKHCD
jgi:Uncharacterized protein conserved in bacteria